MLVDTIRAELVRLQVHPVNLSVSSEDDRLVALQGSLLQYWKLPRQLDSPWLLAQLRELPDAAGPKTVMGSLVAAYRNKRDDITSGGMAQVRLFDPRTKIPATKPATTKRDN
jgi:hypothetical protein